MATRKTDSSRSASGTSRSRRARATAAGQRRIQQETDQQDARKAARKSAGKKAPAKKTAAKKTAAKKAVAKKRAAPTRARKEPRSPMPAQHQRKPGRESELDPRPRFLAEGYRGSGKLQDKVAIITGGDSGIGRAVAVLFAREGADVAIVYLSEHGDAKETAGYVEKEGRRCLVIPGDVRDPAFCREAVDKVVDAFGRLDVLVNNAAFQEHAGSLEEITDEHFDMTMRTNIYGYFNMTRAALPHMQEGSAIVNTGSETGLFGNSHLLDYSATKGAIHAFTMSLAGNLVSRGIRVNAVAPGPVWTPLNPADAPAERVADFGSSDPIGRPAQPEELSPAYVFLASPACSSYVNGAILPVMGGPTG